MFLAVLHAKCAAEEHAAIVHGASRRAASGKLPVDTERVPLADIENAWNRDPRGGRVRNYFP